MPGFYPRAGEAQSPEQEAHINNEEPAELRMKGALRTFSWKNCSDMRAHERSTAGRALLIHTRWSTDRDSSDWCMPAAALKHGGCRLWSQIAVLHWFYGCCGFMSLWELFCTDRTWNNYTENEKLTHLKPHDHFPSWEKKQRAMMFTNDYSHRLGGWKVWEGKGGLCGAEGGGIF